MKKLLFTPENLQKAEDGRKTQTRRLGGLSKFNGQPDRWQREGNIMAFDGGFDHVPLPKPNHAVGDIVVGATTWAVLAKFDHLKPTELDPNGIGPHFAYLAGHESHYKIRPHGVGKSRPGRFLPKTLYHYMPKFRITAVGAERLHDITLADAIAEGCPEDQWDGLSPLDWFEELWNSINEKAGRGWDTNPWVFVYEFERVAS